MNFSFSEEQDAIRELAQQILGDACGHDRLSEIERDEATQTKGACASTRDKEAPRSAAEIRKNGDP